LTVSLYFGKVKRMSKESNDIWSQPFTSQFAQTLTAISEITEMQNFLCDVMTEKEITEMSARLQAARMLKEGATYTAITQATALSSRTVARISNWLQNGYGGYETALANEHHKHTPPVSTA
jgi:TrpR-related protein YerC/YecD